MSTVEEWRKYRPLQEIETTEEASTLPDRSIVIDSDGDAAQRRHIDGRWAIVGLNGLYDTGELEYPLILLWIPLWSGLPPEGFGDKE